MSTCHIITNAFHPTPGGLTASVLRIAQIINRLDGWRARVYVLDENTKYATSRAIPDLDVILLESERTELLKPLKRSDRHRFRTDFLLLRRAIEEDIATRSSDINVILPFYVTETGFIAQRVALALGLPHVPCFRGSDFSKDFFDPSWHPVISHLMQHASAIVTTNNEQHSLLQAAFGERLQIRTIYNSSETPNVYWSKKNTGTIQLVSDCGYSFKKGTHVLLHAWERLLSEGWPLEMSICGETAFNEQDYWDKVRSDLSSQYGERVKLNGLLERSAIKEMLLSADLYCCATLGEGCSQARSRALVLGMPITSTRCGELKDLALEASHIALAEPGDIEGFVTALRSSCEQVLEGSIEIDMGCVAAARLVLSTEIEQAAWLSLLTSVAHQESRRIYENQFRILMYAHDGRGLGHLRRLCRIAQTLQGACAVLVVTGHRAASWLVPETCEFIHLPSFDSLDPSLSKQWGRSPFWHAGKQEGVRLRKALIKSAIETFAPHAIVIDYLPSGKDDEMFSVVDNCSARCYLLLRGILDEHSALLQDILTPQGLYLLENRYDRILVMADSRVVDVAMEYELPKSVAGKIVYAGYVTEQVSESNRSSARVQRGIPDGSKWVVCSAGGGKDGEQLVEFCSQLAHEFDGVFFDIVLGPRSRSSFNFTPSAGPERIRVHKERVDLPLMHAACDVLICRGGYNSLMEAAVGNARIMVVPTDGDHEQLAHATRLAGFLPIKVVTEAPELRHELQRQLTAVSSNGERQPLNLSGADFARQLILADLNGFRASFS